MLYKIITKTAKFNSLHVSYCQEEILKKITFALIRNGHELIGEPEPVSDHDLHELISKEENIELKNQWENQKLVYYRYVNKDK